MPLQQSKLPQTRYGTQCSLSNTHSTEVKSKSWLWNINHECSVLSGSYKHVIHVNIDLLHSHLPDGAGVLIYTDVMHQLLPLSLSLVDLRSFNMPLAACWGTASHSGQAGSWLWLTAFQSSTSTFCLIFEWGRGCCNALQHMQHS